MATNTYKSSDTDVGNADELRDRLGFLAKLGVKRADSDDAAVALRRVGKARSEAQMAIAIFSINNKKEAIMGNMAANAVTVAGVIETKLATNASSALDALGTVKIAGFVGAFEARHLTIRELTTLVERGVITAAEAEELIDDADKQLENRKEDVREIDSAARNRMKAIISAGGPTNRS